MKTKFKLRTKIGQTVNYIEINIRADCDKYKSTNHNKDGVHVNKLKIVYQTYWKIALNSEFITLLDRKKEDDRKESYKHHLEDCNVSIITKEDYWPNGIFGTIYTLGDTNKAIKKLTKEMQSQVNKQYGFMFNINIEDKVLEYLK